jgi:hypothetical protein
MVLIRHLLLRPVVFALAARMIARVSDTGRCPFDVMNRGAVSAGARFLVVTFRHRRSLSRARLVLMLHQKPDYVRFLRELLIRGNTLFTLVFFNMCRNFEDVGSSELRTELHIRRIAPCGPNLGREFKGGFLFAGYFYLRFLCLWVGGSPTTSSVSSCQYSRKSSLVTGSSFP